MMIDFYLMLIGDHWIKFPAVTSSFYYFILMTPVGMRLIRLVFEIKPEDDIPTDLLGGFMTLGGILAIVAGLAILLLWPAIITVIPVVFYLRWLGKGKKIKEVKKIDLSRVYDTEEVRREEEDSSPGPGTESLPNEGSEEVGENLSHVERSLKPQQGYPRLH